MAERKSSVDTNGGKFSYDIENGRMIRADVYDDYRNPKHDHQFATMSSDGQYVEGYHGYNATSESKALLGESVLNAQNNGHTPL